MLFDGSYNRPDSSHLPSLVISRSKAVPEVKKVVRATRAIFWKVEVFMVKECKRRVSSQKTEESTGKANGKEGPSRSKPEIKEKRE